MSQPQTLKPWHPDTIFNGFIGANVIYAFQRIQLFSVLQPGLALTPNEVSEKTKTDLERLCALLRAGIAFGFFRQNEDGTVYVTEAGEEVRRLIGYFTWSVGGYGQVLRELGNLSQGDKRWNHFRDEGMVALGSDQNNRSFMRHLLDEVLDGLTFNTIADLGCGNAGRLIDSCYRYPHVHGVGIDISEAAIDLAAANVQKHGMSDRIRLICANVLSVIRSEEHQSILADVDIVTSFMMLHDLYNLSHIWDKLFDQLLTVFPNASYYLFADTVRMPPLEELEELPIFNVGFELLHSFMGVRIPTKSTYDRAFAKAGLTVEKCIPFGTPNTYLYVLKV